MNNKNFLKTLLKNKLVAIVRLQQQDQVARVLENMVLGGVQVLEITSNTPGFAEEIKIARNKYPKILIGAGTITSTDLALKAIKAGGQFIVTPSTDTEIVRLAHHYDIPVLMGATTPTEINIAVEAGADIVKLFPAAPLGLDYFKAIKAPFNQVPFFAVGGIGKDNLKDWLNAGAAGVGIGSSLAKPTGNTGEQQNNIAEVKEIVDRIKNS
ncbi:bifunctional 4-hydroxy-2-oxoglutarate aldolase/2-dehydro-3-deoxy-phosphogluconate aldolase [Flavobacteriaceae bacterium F89]|uniref:Bifunctional 4-hydroxy-2-oxoglutarate aldolase/2-dehydro-3-deoxy-phosphogluconate aldolase n=1 Tax=Cerina litoralis TaxID=2874477 RepID=A0AAE3EUB3_9FLAO|nr:bifunctional 4-hydroxy-2-oxoglutarate aldolase/2-dehydro-3-deoxy-phosphogluconate aldolase [Cerina litoralis]MCG2460488.1 bifunctional 4-hydroxy-2-oxoglutarate aldolase/2-dehydro-3-deoxy-phosphogluconate aldolase [Cerina litoralis]